MTAGRHQLLYTYAELIDAGDFEGGRPPVGRSAKVRLTGAEGYLTCVNPLVTAFVGDPCVRHPR